MNQLSRHEERRAAMQILFACVNQRPAEAEMDLLYDQVVADADYQAFLPQVVNGVLAAQDSLDADLGQHLAAGWRIDRLARVPRVILRIAAYELQLNPATPYRVVVDEAVELAKEFADPEDAQFVNGVLKNYAPEEA
ncbi:transcription antitermination factor NusB [Leuconostocaceae bacterium ESL0958]|nr:transcription antitermination factor NusB [Leuconostocaceae bacterium ESL0958]